MNKELTLKLNADYPELFLFKNFKSANYFIIECDDGWYNILNALLRQIVSHVKHHNREVDRISEAEDMIHNGFKDDVPRYMLTKLELLRNGNGEYPQEMDYPEIHQIKEKFGTLRFYTDVANGDYIKGVIAMSESMSDTTCERCGDVGKIVKGRWIKTLCPVHEQEHIRNEETRRLESEASAKKWRELQDIHDS